MGTNFSRHNFWTSCWYYILLRATAVDPWCSSGIAIHLVELSLRLLVVMRHRRRRTLASPPLPPPPPPHDRVVCSYAPAPWAWHYNWHVGLHIVVVVYAEKFALQVKSRLVSTRHRRPNDDYAVLHICAKIERRAFPIRAIRRPLSAIKHYHNEVNFVIHSA